MAGRRLEKALTVAFIKTVKEPGKYFDGHGLYLKVEPNGSRFWVQRIAVRGKRTELGLGSPSLVPLKEAREKALANRKLAREGGDPLQFKRSASAMMTFEEAAREVHRLHVPIWTNAKYKAQFLTSLETYAFPRIGSIRMADVTPADVLAVLTPLWAEKVDMARRVRQRIGTVMKWGVAKGWRLDNPAENVLTGLPRQPIRKTPRKSLPYDAVAGCLQAARFSNTGLSIQLALEFIILTATRSGETREAVWSEFDLNRAVWEISAERMKMKRAHRVPLSPRAIEILRQAQGLGDGVGLVFPGSRAKRPMTDRTLSQFVKRLGFDADVHGFRTSFRTWAQERTNFPREVAEFALAHV
ncbi:MAG TPA: integrase arm-type DNA-binding domain-containing protein, partial [Rubellimicrobium sp.]|nr:integrase arm-type DNA-binding domain-containing protein [Rubellimicrobium sp.]